MSKPPFRADHVGSLLRPKELLQARSDHAAGRITAEELRRREDDAIREVVKRQEEIGLQGVTDGEFRRIDWIMDFKYGIGGVKKLGTRRGVPFQARGGAALEWTFEEYTVAERMRLDRVIFADDFRFLASVAKATPKLTIPSPSMMHYPAGRGIDRMVYPDDEPIFADLVQVYRDEIDGLVKLGCTYLQLDDTSLAILNDPKRRAQLGPGAERLHERYIRMFNDAIAQRPPGMTICTHLCRGNYKSAWIAEGSYDYVADAMFNGLNVDGFFLEYDDDRSGGFESLRFVPKGKMIVLGLVTTKTGTLEKKDDIKRRIDQAAKFVPLDQLCLSPQCGFASTAEGNLLSIDEQFGKLRLIVETAHEVWG